MADPTQMTLQEELLTVEPWVWTAASTCAFGLFIIVPERLKEMHLSYASLTAMVINCHYALWAVQVNEWVHSLVDSAFWFYLDTFPPPKYVALTTWTACVSLLLYLTWEHHGRRELKARRDHERRRPDEWRRKEPLVPGWGLMSIWTMSLAGLFQWVGGIHILMHQVYPVAVCVGIFLMIFIP
eukprot:TRINITY_DN7996_c0_g2_i1.p1 TRINITY_DN7996_c0_g2~~TRINITY_DN7996_c0_g2_i1.p1  ORF type:complete len:202 (+),score=76.76 TRINITY_DN7996_c0_g2_i1:60-608(+)